ncbi:MAG: outer membrane protein assembly factor BamA [Alphaproteobacteria bacterium]|jgi:outer membrane protein insertion porin family|nr:outer membrane protein assembly factor BamA [Alphaproteobacteria bacterium]MBT4016426.1 outer membrane protein assembly factor BamA [Alphaproteobacteria bacterium]MBT4965976.1 outer membrane protein assembly factor BamA [Alphaproteobacteria bacterium]MBT5160421.1 outer membrane protein assembly factor BamA [Alphaproteobacteria bacterium]MBT6385207.1 outer membrane protein assembly factor BamA [Alphaproteobacteria bacterium]
MEFRGRALGSLLVPLRLFAAKRHFLSVVTVLVAGLTFGQAGEVRAQSASAPRVEAIEVEGNQRVEADAVRSYMTLAPGDNITNDSINRSLKTLYGTGLFADVTIRMQGRKVVVNVVENPIINRMAFEGNKRVKAEELEAEIQLRPRIVFTRTKVQSDVQRMIQIYRRKGRFAATIEPKVIQLAQNRVDLVFEISEGPVTGIRKIDFIGNKMYPDGQLRSEIITKETRWYRFLSSDDNYDPDRMTFDRELLRRFYLSKGYADFLVASAVAELTRDRKDFFVTFTVDEGQQYKFGTVEVTSGIKDVDTGHLLNFVGPKVGEIYNATKIEKTIQDLTFEVGRLGYAFVDIRPLVKRNKEDLTISLTFNIAEGPRVYVDRIEVENNVRTLDEVVRREFQLAEGDAFNTAKLRETQRRLRNLGFFDKVDVSDDRGLLDDETMGGAKGEFGNDRTVITVDVKEKSTGELSFGAGFSTAENIVGDVSIRERNLLGRGQDLKLGVNFSKSRQQVDLSFTEPYFLQRDLAAGFDIFNIRRDFQSESSYDSAALGITLRSNFPIAQHLRQNVRYTLREDVIENVGADASRFISEQTGTRITSSVGYTLAYDLRDRRVKPTQGYLARISQDLAGLGGNVAYIKSKFNFSYYYPINDTFTGILATEEGYVLGLGERVRITDRFFLGGGSFRGFESAGVGPKDTSTDDSLGGKLFYVGTAAVRFPFGPFDEYDITGDIYTEIGSLMDPDLSDNTDVFDDGAPRFTIGFGMSWQSPFGPIRLDFTEALVAKQFDEKEFFRFSFGTRF